MFEGGERLSLAQFKSNYKTETNFNWYLIMEKIYVDKNSPMGKSYLCLL